LARAAEGGLPRPRPVPFRDGTAGGLPFPGRASRVWGHIGHRRHGRDGRNEVRAMEMEIGAGKTARRAYGFDEVAIVPSRRTRDPDDVDISWEIDAYRFEL